MLGWKLNGDGETKGLVRDIEKSQQRLQRLFDDLRGYATPMKLERRPHNVRDILAEAWAGLEHQRDGRDVDFRQDPAVADTRCVVDPLALEQVFQNVLENALAACADPVAIDVRFTEVSMDGRELLEIAIRDNGPGMTDEQREKIFQPFYSTKSRGSGLGMAITRRIVQAHGGRITVGDTSFAGTEIVIDIPRGEP
jgi:signal transduction histidine kinase